MAEATDKEADQGAESSGAQDLVLKVLGAIGTGIGILGFVTFFGGAIIWVRADKAGLPATEAVAVIPRSVLVTTGVTFLFPAFLVAVGVVAVVFLIHLTFYGFEQRDQKETRERVRKFRTAAAQVGRAASAAEGAWKAADAVLNSKADDLATAHQRHAAGTEITELEKGVEDQRVEVARLRAAGEGAASAAGSAKANAENLTEESEVKLRRGPLQWWLELGVAAVALLFIVPWQNGAILHPGDGWNLAILILVAVSGTALTLLAYFSTGKFVWFGVAAVIAVGVYLAAGTYLSTKRNAKMQPVAALRSGHSPVVGTFIADTSESLYVGTLRENNGAPPRLMVIPRSQVTEIAIGPLLNEGEARIRATDMALDECSQQVEETQPEKQSQPNEGASVSKTEVARVTKPACSEAQITELESIDP
jgi:hypothetical protein